MRRPVHFVLPGSIERKTGGTIYDRRIVEGLRATGTAIQVHELEGRFPLADGRARDAAARASRSVPADAILVVDGLALPAFEALVPTMPRDRVALIHHPLALETGLSRGDALWLARVEAHLLSLATRIVVTSRQTARDLEAYHVSPDRIGVVLPGTDPAPLARGSAGPGLLMLTVGALIGRKGHLILLRALARLRDFDWRLECVGSTQPDPQTVAEIRALIERSDLGDRITLMGECSPADLEGHYARADLFVLASHHEGYGMALAEALARGLPVVSTMAGAIPDTVPETAGLLVPPGDMEALATALRRVITDHDLRGALASGALRARDDLPTWSDACRSFGKELALVDAAAP